VPRRIDVDCQVNASASLGRSIWSVFSSRGLVLTIGLSLVAGMNLRQFAGVLAHEMGHFSQGAGMRLGWLVGYINHWFTRAVYERDEWDYRLEAWSKQIDIRLAIFVLLARLGVWITRRVLWCFMMLGHVLCAHLSRQMEYDADRKGAMLVGSEASEDMLRHVVVLSAAQEKSSAELDFFYEDGRLADNLPRLVALNAQAFDEEDLRKIDEMRREMTSGLFDTHPSSVQRGENLRRLDAPGTFHVERPATVLFDDFNHLAKSVTLDFYRALFGPKFDVSKIHPLDDLLKRRDREIEAGKTLDRFMAGKSNRFRPISIPGSVVPECDIPRQTAGELKQAREAMARLTPQYAKDMESYEEACAKLCVGAMGRTAFRAGFGAKVTKSADPPMASLEEASAICRDNRIRLDRMKSQLVPFEEAAGRRILAGLSLLNVDKVIARIPEGDELAKECDRILPVLWAMERENEVVCGMYPVFSGLSFLLSLSEKVQDHDRWVREVLDATRLLRGRVQQCRQALFGVQYVMDHAEQGMTVGRYLVEEMPPADNPPAVYHVAEAMMDSYQMLRARLRGRLATAVEKVETVLGLEPLPTPPKKEEKT
jgi:Zn-dependent protease with chaperone function